MPSSFRKHLISVACNLIRISLTGTAIPYRSSFYLKTHLNPDSKVHKPGSSRDFYFGGARSKGFATLRNVSKLQFFDKIGASKVCRFSALFGYLTSSETQGQSVEPEEKARRKFSSTGGRAPGRDPFNQNSNRSDREKRTTSGPVFSKPFRLDRTDPLGFAPKFPESLVEWIAPPGYRLSPDHFQTVK